MPQLNQYYFDGRMTRDPELVEFKGKKRYEFELVQQTKPYPPVYAYVHVTTKGGMQAVDDLKLAKGDRVMVDGPTFSMFSKDKKHRSTVIRAGQIWLVNRAKTNVDSRFKNVDQPKTTGKQPAAPTFKGI